MTPAGDDRHVAVSTMGGFHLLDVGTWGEPHGDHAHHFTAPPALTGLRIAEDTPGHVVAHEGRTAFVDDGTGEITVIDSRDVADPAARRTVGSEDAHHRVGVVGDYQVDEGAELERPERASLVDTRECTLRLVDLPASYSFRSLGRGPAGEALVLGTDGRLHVIDPDPPSWSARGGIAYVTEPSRSRVIAADFGSGGIRAEHTLPHTPDELTGVSGDVPDTRE